MAKRPIHLTTLVITCMYVYNVLLVSQIANGQSTTPKTTGNLNVTGKECTEEQTKRTVIAEYYSAVCYREERTCDPLQPWICTSKKVSTFCSQLRYKEIYSTSSVAVCCHGYDLDTSRDICIRVCPPGMFGDDCSESCGCLLTQNCDPYTGACTCKPGYTGTGCVNVCQPKTYGVNCAETCNCDWNNTISCDGASGDCWCRGGWMGKSCQTECPPDYYGFDCKNKCNCSANQTCDLQTGDCACATGYTGVYCTERIVPSPQGQDDVPDYLLIVIQVLLAVVVLVVILAFVIHCVRKRNIRKSHDCTDGSVTGNTNTILADYYSNLSVKELQKKRKQHGDHSPRRSQAPNGSLYTEVDKPSRTKPKLSPYQESGVVFLKRTSIKDNAIDDLVENGNKNQYLEGADQSQITAYVNEGAKTDDTYDKLGKERHVQETEQSRTDHYDHMKRNQCKTGHSDDAYDELETKSSEKKLDNNIDDTYDHTHDLSSISVILVGVDVSHAAKAQPETTSSGSPQIVNLTTNSGSNTDLFFEPKNCTRQKIMKTCSGLWFWEKCRTQYSSSSCTKTRMKLQTMSTAEAICCEGFVPYNDTAPFCLKGCETGRYGENCTRECNCTGNTRPDCDLTTGDCKCTEGWTGPNCTDVCAKGFYGHNCENACPCENNSTCDHMNGTCNCTSPGWTGDKCDTVCPEGRHGHYCKQNCSCPINATCDPFTGECQCIAGLTGGNCTNVCDDGYFGADCKQTCTCIANRTRACDPANGTCSCAPGWTGRNCAKYCLPGTFGESCQETCNCTDTEACNPMNGQCVSRFLCSVNGTSNCDPTLGVCDCSGVQQNIPLDLSHGSIRDILNNPKDICDSVNNQTEFCVPRNGSVRCECLAGWIGYSCEKPCPRGMYGEGCGQRCTCGDGEGCDHVDGRCVDTGNSKRQDTNQDTPDIGLVLGIVISSTVVIIVVVICVVMYKRKGGRKFSDLQMTVRKTRTANERSFADNHTYDLRQPDIIEATSRRPVKAEGSSNENDNTYVNSPSNGHSSNREKGATRSKDNYSRVVKCKDGNYDDFKSMGLNENDGNAYAGNIADDVYNTLNNKDGRHSNGVSPRDDEYSHANFAAASDTYDVMSRRTDPTSGENMYESSRELSNTYDVFRNKGDTDIISDSMYDTQSNIAAESGKNSKHYSLPS
ncbi:protein draper-like [Pecten maximus]|uniref:protein draper-like n=1 Tax=Pecten maximus TaxID=6579 RepID=UPI00145808B6|nr:protein draper-like [Pecten maximus]